MRIDCTRFYLNGDWRAMPGRPQRVHLDPATGTPCASVALGTAVDVDDAVRAAHAAFPLYAQTSVAERLAFLDRIIAGMRARAEELAQAVTLEMGAPIAFARSAHVPSGLAHLVTARRILADYHFETWRGTTGIQREAIGVCALITPWNWPLNQVTCKLAPALATGCTVVHKPSELAPLSADLLTQIIAEAGLPAGVFNLVHGAGPTVGAALAAHPLVDMVSFTGSTRAGRAVAHAAADTIKRVTLELGGKSPNLLLDDADFGRAVTVGVHSCFSNAGQSCNAPTRMLVPEQRLAEVLQLAQQAAARVLPGDPALESTRLGPLVSAAQYERVQALIQAGIDEGATLVCGGPGKPAGLEAGCFVRPTIFANVHNQMRIAREEIFGPVLCILTYRDEDEAVALANDSDYGLSGQVWGEVEHARRVARRLRTGMVHINGAGMDFNAPFGGYRQSGNGREWGLEGFEDYLETKALLGDRG
jgi:aldehyde dehydrogenase (NAD+)